MKKEISLIDCTAKIDTDYYDGVVLVDKNGKEMYLATTETINLSRFFDLLPYRGDVIYYLEENDFKERINNEDYVVAVTEEYERLRFYAEVSSWEDCLQEAVEKIDYDEYIDWDKTSEEVHESVQATLDKVFNNDFNKYGFAYSFKEQNNSNYPYQIHLKIDHGDSIGSTNFDFSKLDEVNFFLNFIDNGFYFNIVDTKKRFNEIYTFLNDDTKVFGTDGYVNSDGKIRAEILSSDNGIVYETKSGFDQIFFNSREEDYRRFKEFITNQEYKQKNSFMENNKEKVKTR